MDAPTVLALNCTLKPGPDDSSTQLMIDQLFERFREHGCRTESIRVVDHDVAPGVTHDEGGADEWPLIRQRILAADVLVLGTPVWLGSPSSVAKRVVERLDAFLSDADDLGRYPTTGKVAVVAVVGNEDGAHHCAAECFQWLNDVGFTIAASANVYWVGEAMGSTDFNQLPETPQKVASTMDVAAANAVHLSRLLQATPFPGTPPA